jgi:hypothetical protein
VTSTNGSTERHPPHAGQVVALAEDQLHLLANPYALDGGVSTHPPGSSGTATMNCYLLSCADRHVLIDAGLTIHEQAIIAQLATLLAPGRPLDVMPLRFGEFNAICNVGALAERFGVGRVYGTLLGAPQDWLDFHGAPSASRRAALARAQEMPLPPVGTIVVGRDRALRTLLGPLRLLPLPWAFDEATGMMYTADIFTWIPSTGAADAVLDDGADDGTTEDDVLRALLDNRYWWLQGARTDGIRAELDALYAEYDIAILAPGYGRVVTGRTEIARQFALLDQALARAGAADPPSPAGTTTTIGRRA